MPPLLPRLPLPQPRRLLAPARLVPAPVLEALIARLAQRVLAEPLQDGALDLLEQRILAITVHDPMLRLRFTLRDGRLHGGGPGPANVTITGRAEDLVLLAARRTDPDSLFFQRRLRISGDTELGLAVKNVLDTVDLHSLPTPLQALLEQLADRLESSENPAVPYPGQPRG